MRVVVVVAALVAVATSPTVGQGGRARLVREIPWANTGISIAIDTHVHTRFSDGDLSVPDLVARAQAQGCGALAITDHADRTLRGATPAYQEAIEAARAANPGLVIVAGLEWNVPPAGGREHVNVLVPSGPDEWATLAEFKRRFDDFEREDGVKPSAGDALRWLNGTAPGAPRPVVIYNHPGRYDTSSLSNVDDMLAWRSVNDLVIGFEGAPGHQGTEPIGSYTKNNPTIDRWDRVAAEPGDAWDTLLQRGVDVTAALAGSDYHNDNPNDLRDFTPCRFAETWISAPERSVAGVLAAMRAGAAVGVHGKIARDIALTVAAPGLARPAVAGEVVQAPVRTVLTVRLAFSVPATDWQGMPNRIDAAELVTVDASGATLRSRPVPAGSARSEATWSIPVPPGGVVVRARGRRVVEDGPDLLFYTNPIRILPDAVP